MIEEMFLPPYLHYDHGFTAMANSFERVAKESSKEKRGDFNQHIPIAFLLRHAIELYLKGAIVILNKRLNLTDGKEDSICSISEGSDRISFKKVHSLSRLFEHFRVLVTSHQSQLSKIAKTDWTKIPEHIDIDIKLVEQVDRTSTFFRYPDPLSPVGDKVKSGMQERTPETLPTKPTISLLVETPHGNKMYSLDDQPMNDTVEALFRLVETLSGAALGLRYEIGENRLE